MRRQQFPSSAIWGPATAVESGGRQRLSAAATRSRSGVPIPREAIERGLAHSPYAFSAWSRRVPAERKLQARLASGTRLVRNLLARRLTQHGVPGSRPHWSLTLFCPACGRARPKSGIRALPGSARRGGSTRKSSSRRSRPAPAPRSPPASSSFHRGVFGRCSD